MAHRVPRGVERLELDRAPDADDVSRPQPAVDPGDRRVGVGEDLRPGRGDHRVVPPDVVEVLVGVEDLGDLEAPLLRLRKAFPVVEGVDRERLPGLRAGDEIVEVAIVVTGPDLFDDHAFFLFERDGGGSVQRAQDSLRDGSASSAGRRLPLRCGLADEAETGGELGGPGMNPSAVTGPPPPGASPSRAGRPARGRGEGGLERVVVHRLAIRGREALRERVEVPVVDEPRPEPGHHRDVLLLVERGGERGARGAPGVRGEGSPLVEPVHEGRVLEGDEDPLRAVLEEPPAPASSQA